MMKLRATVVGDIAKQMEAEIKAGEAAATRAVNAAGLDLKGRWRGQIRSADLGNRLANAIRNQTFPANGASINAAALVWSAAPTITDVFDRGATIRGRGGQWLAIPNSDALGGRLRGISTPAEWEARTGMKLAFVKRRRPLASLLVAPLRVRRGKRGGFAVPTAGGLVRGTGLATVAIFFLVPQVTLRKRLDLSRDADAVANGIPADIVKRWEARS